MTYTFDFDGEPITVNTDGQYNTGAMAVQAFDADGAPYATLSVNMPGGPWPTDVFYLKDWSENERIATAFIASGLVELAKDVGPRSSGYVTSYAYRFVS